MVATQNIDTFVGSGLDINGWVLSYFAVSDSEGAESYKKIIY